MARDVSSPEKGGGFAFFNVGTIMTGGGVRGADAVQEDVWVREVRPSGASSRRVSGSWVRHVRGSFATTMQSCWGSVLDACTCACFPVRVRVLVFVCFGFASPECGCGNRRARFVYSLQVVVEKNVERCKGSVELLDFMSKAS